MIQQTICLCVAFILSSNAFYLQQQEIIQTEPCKMTFTLTTSTGEIISGDLDYLFAIYRENEHKIKRSFGYRQLAIQAEQKYLELQIEIARNNTDALTAQRIMSTAFWDFFEKQFELIGWHLITYERIRVTITFVPRAQYYPPAESGGTVTSQSGTGGSISSHSASGGSGSSHPGTGGTHSGTGGTHSGTGGAHSGTGGTHSGTGGTHSGTGGTHSGTGGAHSGTGGTHSGTGGSTSSHSGTGGSSSSHSGSGGSLPYQTSGFSQHSSHSQSRYLPSSSPDHYDQSQLALNYTSEELY